MFTIYHWCRISLALPQYHVYLGMILGMIWVESTEQQKPQDIGGRGTQKSKTASKPIPNDMLNISQILYIYNNKYNIYIYIYIIYIYYILYIYILYNIYIILYILYYIIYIYILYNIYIILYILYYIYIYIL